VLGSDVSFHFSWPITFKTLLELATTNSIIFMSLLTGGVVLGIPMAVAAWFLSNTIIRRKSLLKPVV
jgi:hypothetical protein